MEKAMDLYMWSLDVADARQGPPGDLGDGREARARARDRVPELPQEGPAGEDVTRFLEVYNAAWERNWGFVPLTEAEVRHYAKELKPVLDENWAMIAERKDTGEVVGAALTLPDFNQVLAKLNGRLLPFGWLHGPARAHARSTRCACSPSASSPPTSTRAWRPRFYEMHFDAAERTPQKRRRDGLDPRGEQADEPRHGRRWAARSSALPRVRADALAGVSDARLRAASKRSESPSTLRSVDDSSQSDLSKIGQPGGARASAAISGDTEEIDALPVLADEPELVHAYRHRRSARDLLAIDERRDPGRAGRRGRRRRVRRGSRASSAWCTAASARSRARRGPRRRSSVGRASRRKRGLEGRRAGPDRGQPLAARGRASARRTRLRRRALSGSQDHRSAVVELREEVRPAGPFRLTAAGGHGRRAAPSRRRARTPAPPRRGAGGRAGRAGRPRPGPVQRPRAEPGGRGPRHRADAIRARRRRGPARLSQALSARSADRALGAPTPVAAGERAAPSRSRRSPGRSASS